MLFISVGLISNQGGLGWTIRGWTRLQGARRTEIGAARYALGDACPDFSGPLFLHL